MLYQIILLRFNSLLIIIIFCLFLAIAIFLFFSTICITTRSCSISLLDLGKILISATLIASGLILIFSFLEIANLLRQDSSIVLLIEHKNRLVAYAIHSNKVSYSLLNSLYVKPDYRRIGLGSCLVQNLASRGVRPIYVIPTTESFRFYIRHGFTLIQEQNLPHELRRIGRISRFLGLIE